MARPLVREYLHQQADFTLEDWDSPGAGSGSPFLSQGILRLTVQHALESSAGSV